MSTILIKKSDTASSVPLASDLTNAAGGVELAVNTADKKIYTKTSGGSIIELTGLKSTDIGVSIQAYDTDLSAVASSGAGPLLASYGQYGIGFRNRIINGDMRIDQRNAGASVTAVQGTPTYPVDRTSISKDTTAGVLTGQRSTTAPAGFTNSLLVTVSTSFTPSSGDGNTLRHVIEGFNVADLRWGTANAQTVTLSFWVRSSVTGTFSGSLVNSAFNRSYPFTYTINSSNTFEQKSITITGDTSGTWLTDNGIGIRLYFNLGSGSSLLGTAGAWTGSGLLGATGSTSVVGTNGATFYITGVQLEAGSVATPFERRPYGTELALCQRYYETGYTRHRVDPFPAGSLGMSAQYAATKRATPTTTATASLGTISGAVDGATTSIFINFSAGASGNVAASWTASSEL